MNRNSQKIRKRLISFLDAGSLPSRELESKAYLATVLETLLKLGIVDRKPGRRGSWRYDIIDRDAFLEFMNVRFPDLAIPQQMTAAEAAGHYGDAHKATVNPHESVTLRIVNDSVILRNKQNDQAIDAYSICTHGGAVTLKLSDIAIEAGTICTVENLQSFWEAEKVIEADCYIYLGGQFSNGLLDWLSSEYCKCSQLIHSGDYDPAGLMIYNRLAQRIFSCELFIPDNLEERLKKSYNSIRLADQQSNIDSLIQTGNRSIRSVLDLILKYGRTLDQEALLLGTPE